MSEAYEFETDTETLRYSSTTKAKAILGNVFNPQAVKRSAIVLDENVLRSIVTFQFPVTNEFALNCLKTSVPNTIGVKVYSEETLIWVGKVISAKLQGLVINLSCEASTVTSITGKGGARFSPYCWKILYSPNCGVSKAAHTYTYSTYSIDNKVISVSILAADNFFLGGTAQIANELRHIVSSTADSITLSDRFTSGLTGDLVLTKGCSLTRASCQEFGNLVNFGGFSYIPLVKTNNGSIA